MRELVVKGLNIKEWESDFRKINPEAELNADLDDENFEQHMIKPEQTFSSARGAEVKNLKMKGSIKICFVGRPNVGKSSLVNEILGEERMVVSEEPYTTNDSISNKILYKDRKIELVDTAGLDNHNI
jgi:predicted GTPase